MRVLVACEKSQTVCKEFRKLGHEAYSCDIEDCTGENPEWHIKDDVLIHLNDGWDLMIAHPPCTDLAVSGARWFPEKKKNGQQQKSIEFFMQFTKTTIPKVCIENPIGIMSSLYRKPNQVIQPYYFGHPEFKATCFWLKALPRLNGTNYITPPKDGTPEWNAWNRVHKCPPSANRKELRAWKYNFIAKAMAEQWGGNIL
jgi:hypothetical protein